MSKGNDQGPGAGSFELPSKTGWLYKHGGSGMSSHWRKRWFVADHHYLFYYKGPNDKKPVGIVCLPEYESCHKTEGKVWKKQNTFMLDRGNSAQEPDSPDGASAKNYVLYADSEEEMLEWIKALTEEMKPMIGENPYANGFGGGKTSTESTKASKSKQKKSKGDTVAVDDKALDDVTAMAGEGPKLTHLTTSRPKVPRGRRPPKRYAVFHEDDSNPEAHESPSESPDQSKTSEAPPSPTPGESPSTQRKKGHKPTAPLLPSANRTMSVRTTPKTPPTPPAKVAKPDTPDVTNAVESESPTTTPPLKPKFAKPLPPKKPVKEKPEIPVVEPSEPPSPLGIQRPAPPIKPAKESKEEKAELEPSGPPSPSSLQRPTPPIKPAKETNEEKAEPVVLSEGVTKPSPVKKPRPQPPVKRRTSSGNKPLETTAAPPQVADSAPQPAVRPMPAPRPVPRKRVLSPQHVTREPTQVIKEEVETKEEIKPTAVEEPVAPAEEVKAPTTPTPATPTPTTPTAAAPEVDVKPPTKEEVVEPEKQVKQVEEKTASKEAALPIDVQAVEKPVEPVIPEIPVSKEAAVAKTEAEGEETKVLPDVSEDVAAAGEGAGEKLPVNGQKKEEISEVKSTAAPEEEKRREEGIKKEAIDVESEKEKKEKVEDEDTYEDMDMGEDKDDSQQPTNVKKDEEYEVMTFDSTEEGTEKETKKDVVEKTVADEHLKQRVAPGKINQYDEVAGDFLLYNPTEPAATSRGAVAPGRINQYDEVAGDFLPLNYSKPKVASPSSTSTQEGGPGGGGGVTPRIPPGYEIMGPAAPAVVEMDSDYVPMQDGVMIDAEIVKQISSPPLVSSGSHDDTHLAPETNSRQSVASSSGSTTSDVMFQFSPSDRKPRTGSGNELTVAEEEGRRRGSSGASNKSGDGPGLSSSQLHRDSLGYTKIKQGSVDRVNSVTSDYDRIITEAPPEIIPMATTVTEEPRLSIPETLQQAKEILRLAKVVKAEAEQMRVEARKELTLAKKDRHDAMLMKKNAAEILRMAKERLGSSTK